MAQTKYEIFLKVVEMGSLTRAAEQFGYTQSAVSHAIHALESETGLRLIHRSRTGVRLTPEGEKLMPAFRRIAEAMQNYADTLEKVQGLEKGCVRIGAFNSVAVRWLPRMIKEYQQSHPQIEFRLLIGDYHDIADWFDAGSIDIGFVTRKTGLDSAVLTEDRLLAVLPKNHRLAGQAVIDPREFAGESFISLMENSNQDARSVLDLAGVQVDEKFTTKDDYAMLAMVEQGLGISIMPELLLEGRTNDVAVAEIAGAQKRTIRLALSPEGSSSPVVKNFAAFVQQWVKEKYR